VICAFFLFLLPDVLFASAVALLRLSLDTYARVSPEGAPVCGSWKAETY